MTIQKLKHNKKNLEELYNSFYMIPEGNKESHLRFGQFYINNTESIKDTELSRKIFYSKESPLFIKKEIELYIVN